MTDRDSSVLTFVRDTKCREGLLVKVDNSWSWYHQEEKSLKKKQSVEKFKKKDNRMNGDDNNNKKEEKGGWVGEQLKLCSDLVPVNPPTLRDEHSLHSVFIEPFRVCLCVWATVCVWMWMFLFPFFLSVRLQLWFPRCPVTGGLGMQVGGWGERVVT